MAGRGPAPADPSERRRRGAPTHEWQVAGGVGWRHGDVPKPPSNLKPASKQAWDIWFAAWFAWFWTPDDVPALRQIIRLYDQVERGELTRHPELRLAMETYGITPKGQMDRRWKPPVDAAVVNHPTNTSAARPTGRYDHLRAVPPTEA